MSDINRIRQLAGLPTVKAGSVLKEEYETSADFEADVSAVEQHFRAAFKIIKGSSWVQHMKDTDTNYEAHAVKMNKDFILKMEAAKKAFDDLYHHLVDLD